MYCLFNKGQTSVKSKKVKKGYWNFETGPYQSCFHLKLHFLEAAWQLKFPVGLDFLGS
jgi:hypothetical protein